MQHYTTYEKQAKLMAIQKNEYDFKIHRNVKEKILKLVIIFNFHIF